MAYEKQNFLDGQIITADHLNHMENGIIAAQNPRNLLDNSDFRIAQAGYGGMHGTQKYACDRWYDTYGFGSFSFNESEGLTIAYGTNHAYLVQKINGASLLHGKTVTLAMQLSDGSVYAKSGVFVSDGASFRIDIATDKNVTLFSDRVEFVVTSGSMTIKWAALYEGSYTADTMPPYVPKDIMVEMISCGVPLNPRNLLDNSDFTNPVNQRGSTSYSTQWAYTIDRWYLPGSTVPVTVGGGYVSFCTADQFIGKEIKDGYYTAAIKLLDGRVFSGSAYYTAGKSATMLANNGVIDCYLMGDAGSDAHPRLRFQTVSGAAISFVWAALYEGSYTADTLPPYVPKGYAAELAECRLYYRPQQMYCLYCYSSGYAVGINFEPMRPGVMPTPVNAKAQTMIGDAVAGETNIVVTQIDRISYVANTNFTYGNYYRVFSEFSSDL